MPILLLSNMRSGSTVVAALLNVQNDIVFADEWTLNAEDNNVRNVRDFFQSHSGFVGDAETIETVAKRWMVNDVREKFGPLKIVWLIRRPDHVASSFVKRRKSLKQVTWHFEMAYKLYWSVQPDITIRFCDFINDPVTTLSHMFTVCGWDTEIDPATFEYEDEPTHIYQQTDVREKRWGLIGEAPIILNKCYLSPDLLPLMSAMGKAPPDVLKPYCVVEEALTRIWADST